MGCNCDDENNNCKCIGKWGYTWRIILSLIIASLCAYIVVFIIIPKITNNKSSTKTNKTTKTIN